MYYPICTIMPNAGARRLKWVILGYEVECSDLDDLPVSGASINVTSRYAEEFMSLDSEIHIDCEPGLSPASGFEHPPSTLPTRFPAALGIGHGLPAA